MSTNYRVGIDVGGTFTDAVALSIETGQLTQGKAPTTPGNHVEGIVAALARCAAVLGTSRDDFVGRCETMSIGTTLVTNTVAEMRGRRIGLLTTRGFRDTLKIARAAVNDGITRSVDPFAQAPMPEVVAHDCIVEVAERIDKYGDVVIPLDRDEVEAAIQHLVEDRGIEALAVSYLWSFQEPVHEQVTREVVSSLYPDLYVTLSSELHPTIGEYERTVTTCLNAFVSDAVSSFVERLEAQLRGAGFGGSIFLGQSLGGLIDVAEARERPLQMINSGPSGGVIGAKALATALDIDGLVTADMGGTTFDVALVEREVAVTDHSLLGRFETGISQVDIATVGAGGGSICWTDDRGAPRVGPHSAGAVPGPACYGRGGEHPTVTDVALALGWLDPDRMLGGRLSIDVGAAGDALRRDLGSLGAEPEDVASQMVRVIVENMTHAVRRVSIERGRDPRRLAMLSFGGASGLFAADICRQMGIERVVVPVATAAFSALGLLAGEPLRTETRTVNCLVGSEPLAALNDAIRHMAKRSVDSMGERGLDTSDVVVTAIADMSFAGQSFTIPVPLPDLEVQDDQRDAVIRSFKEIYADRYGPGSVWDEYDFPPVIVNVRVQARKPLALIDWDHLERPATRGAAPLAARWARRAYLPESERWEEIPCFDEAELDPGDEVVGPCILEGADTTVRVPTGARARMDGVGCLHVQVPTVAGTSEGSAA